MSDPFESHWEWMTPVTWVRLHFIEDPAIRDDYDDTGEAQPGVSLCGISTRWSIPGFFTRLSAPRCAHCCRLLGIPRGNGTPDNERARAR